MLYNQRYCGCVPFGEFKKVYRGGTKKRIRVGAPTYAPRPDLRIIDNALWETVQKRLKAVRRTYVREQGGTLWGRPETGRASKYLLSGLARCSCCGSSMITWKGALGSGSKRKLVAHYRCSWNSNRGNAVCSNGIRERQHILDARVLTAIERSILTPAAITFVIENALEMVEQQRKNEPDPTKRLEAEIRRLGRERDNLVNLAAQGRAPQTVLDEIAKRERAIAALEAQLARVPHRLQFVSRDIATLKAGMIERMSRFQDLIHSDIPLARQALRKLLVGPIKCIPVVRDGKNGYAVRGETRLGALVPQACVRLASPRGFEPRLPP
jgi:hypothetical protein